MRTTTTRALGALLIALTLAACGNDDGNGDGYVDLLRFIPDTEEARENVVLGDVARLREHLEVEPPPNGSTAEDELAYLETLVGAAEERQLLLTDPQSLEYFGDHMPYLSVTSQETERNLGFAFDDLNRYAVVRPFGSTGVPEVASHVAMAGRFDPDRAVEAQAQCDDCPEAEQREHRGWTYYHWAQGGRLTPGDGGAGSPLQVAISDGYALRTTELEHLLASLDSRDEGGSLAENGAFRRLAEELDRREVVHGQLTARTPDLAWGAELWEQIEPNAAEGAQDGLLPDRGVPVLRPYVASATGAAIEEREEVLYYLLLHDVPSLAEENLALAEERLEALLDRGHLSVPNDRPFFEAIDVRQEAELLIVRLAGPKMLLPMPSALFLHE